MRDAVVNPESLKKQKRINKMQLTKLYTRLVRLMSDEKTDQEAILQCMESFEAKKFETLQIIDDLISTYRQTGDERNAIKTEAELDNVSTDADRDVALVNQLRWNRWARSNKDKNREFGPMKKTVVRTIPRKIKFKCPVKNR